MFSVLNQKYIAIKTIRHIYTTNLFFFYLIKLIFKTGFTFLLRITFLILLFVLNRMDLNIFIIWQGESNFVLFKMAFP